MRPARAHVNSRASGSRPHRLKTIHFDEVFQNGLAAVKHMIVRYPKKSNEWILLRCDEHSLAFGRNPMLGAARHLNTPEHGQLIRNDRVSVEKLGVRVLGCDEKKAGQNNMVFKARVDGSRRSYANRPAASPDPSAADTTENSTTERQEDVESHEADEREEQEAGSKTFEGVTDPVVGEIYSAHWPRTKVCYAAVLLPAADFQAVGLSGSIFDTALVKYVPMCYRTDKPRRMFCGWAPGYEDGGAKVAKRRFPVLFMDADLQIPLRGHPTFPHKDLFGWVYAKDLRPLDLESPESCEIHGFQKALEFKRRLEFIRMHGFAHVTSTDSEASTSASESESSMEIDAPTPTTNAGSPEADEQLVIPNHPAASPAPPSVRVRTFEEILQTSSVSHGLDSESLDQQDEITYSVPDWSLENPSSTLSQQTMNQYAGVDMPPPESTSYGGFTNIASQHARGETQERKPQNNFFEMLDNPSSHHTTAPTLRQNDDQSCAVTASSTFGRDPEADAHEMRSRTNTSQDNGQGMKSVSYPPDGQSAERVSDSSDINERTDSVNSGDRSILSNANTQSSSRENVLGLDLNNARDGPAEELGRFFTFMNRQSLAQTASSALTLQPDPNTAPRQTSKAPPPLHFTQGTRGLIITRSPPGPISFTAGPNSRQPSSAAERPSIGNASAHSETTLPSVNSGSLLPSKQGPARHSDLIVPRDSSSETSVLNNPDVENPDRVSGWTCFRG
jgi:hypothetical protein